MEEYVPFESIPRLFRDCIISEKIDGTNAQIYITDDFQIYAGSRERYITTSDDNKGFAKWVDSNKEALIKGLGPGRHYGEWWGSGIGRKYGLNDKRFSLFNITRWTDDVRPACCHVVPVLYTGRFSTEVVKSCLDILTINGSYAAPGFKDAEGVVVYMLSSRHLYKATLDGDGHKSAKL